MGGFAPCPYCRMQIPELSEVCGYCQREVGWHGGMAYAPDVAAQKLNYTALVWKGWPWLWHVAAVAAFLGTNWIINGADSARFQSLNGLFGLAIIFLMFMIAFAVPIYVFRWFYVRAKY